MNDGEREQSAGEIRRCIGDLNCAWLEGRAEDLAKYFASDVVVVLPGFQDRVVGRAACVESYCQFLGRAAVKDFRELDSMVDVWDSTGVASHQYHIDYEIDGVERHETVRELLILVREGSDWHVVWRTIVPEG